MTEAEWLTCTDPEPMLEFLRGRTSDRKLRLFGCGCCRRVWGAIPRDLNREVVIAVERFPESPPSEEYPGGVFDHPVLGEALSASNSIEYQLMLAQPADDHRPVLWRVGPASGAAYLAVKYLGRTYYKGTPLSCAKPVARCAARSAAAAGTDRTEEAAQAGLLRCIFGNPFRPVALDRSWKTPIALAIAQAAYEDRIVPAGHLYSDKLAVLADALEDGGCTDAAILGHLRGPGPHVRGCWALDLILGRE